MTTNSRPPLAGVRVVSIELAVAAPLCSRHLADLGADVIKVEHPDGGDFARSYDDAVLGQSAYFVWANRGKRSLALDLKSDAGRTAVERLLDTADVLLHNLSPGAMDRLGFDPGTVSRRWPALVNCAISGYGASGPYADRKALDLLIQGESGMLSVTGTPEEPCKVGISAADMCAAMYALSSILAALHARQSTGLGDSIDVSMLESMADWMGAPLYLQMYRGSAPSRNGARHNMIAPYGPYPTGDGAVVNLAVQTRAQWEGLCRIVLQLPELITDERFRTNDARVRNGAELDRVIEEVLAGHTGQSALQRLGDADIPCGEVRTLGGVLTHPQLEARGRWTSVSTPNGPVRALASPFSVRGTGGTPGRVPALGEDTAAILAELGLDAAAGPSPAG
ncbi:Crotonobetainyl-CoA:carnitine CoA-transferase CaiB [Modestobacter sp. DSM 44400]|uniref:CaiB/BaiF CoA transferase family protein n=1 Tax=Modestobacter sp. DSM 44400 TaxID=1550230 RepID=UPI000897D67B|nr:CaiB/BaiF CoA-transferase family protein [Modestobacter sp. DSM 44400]SDY38613.1 Crotonobetainyl-CoA:carnitine CoA-transferase CaiB [Modestobacter sp. DSM 44400]